MKPGRQIVWLWAPPLASGARDATEEGSPGARQGLTLIHISRPDDRGATRVGAQLSGIVADFNVPPFWHWSDMGAPGTGTVSAGVGAVTVMDGPGASQRPYAWVIGSNRVIGSVRHLWQTWWG